jgi:hypothetical protein
MAQIDLKSGAYQLSLAPDTLTADRTITFPDSSFTVPTSGGLVYLASSRSTTNVSTVDFQEFKSTDYLFYLITGFVKPATGNVQLSMRLMDGASAITTTNYLYIRGGVDSDGTGVYANDADNDNWSLAANVGTQGPAMFSLQLHFQDATDDGWDGAVLVGKLGHIENATGNPSERSIYANYGVDNANLDGIRFYHNSGDVDYHKIVVCGMKGS